MKRQRSFRLVGRFALASLVAFLAVGGALSVVVSRQLRDRQEAAAQFHAVFVTNSILRYVFQARDAQAPLQVNTTSYQDLLQTVRSRILEKPVLRVKIWDRNGTVLFSDEPRLVGRTFEVDADLKEGFDGETSSEVTDLKDAENIFERNLAPKLFATYTPMYAQGETSGAPYAVAEVYQDYAGIQSQVNRVFGELAVTLLAGLAALYMLLFPIVRRVSRTLSEQNTRLEQQAGRLQQLLQNEQQTVADLRELNRLKNEFVAIASHELRTPLTSIIGYAKTLRRPEFAQDAPARDEFLEAIERQGDRLRRLVQNLLATSNAEDDRRRLVLEPIRFDELVREVAAGLGQDRERVALSLPPDLPLMVSDRQCIELILSNLLDNALKFSARASTCEVGARLYGNSLRFWVSDRGVGIPADQLGRVFERFYQVDSSVTRRYGGVGLGLSLVKSLVETLNGSIDVDSEVGRGSTFTVTLPLMHVVAEAGDGNGSGPAETGSAGDGDGQRSGSAKSTLRSLTST